MSASSASTAIHPDDLIKAEIVHAILNGKTEEALRSLSNFYDTITPEIVVGTIKGKRRSVMLSMSKKKARFMLLTLIFSATFS
jgi:hypothetical protein